MRSTSVILLLVGFGFAACEKEVVELDPIPDPVVNTDSFNLSVVYNNYLPGVIYQTDTIQFDYRITNLDTKELAKDSEVLMACKFDTTVFALDLIGSGPTEVTVPTNLGLNDFFNKDSGYLLGSSLLAYFGVDSMEIGLMIYGPAGSAVDEFFPKDKNPVDNKAVLKIYSDTTLVLQQ